MQPSGYQRSNLDSRRKKNTEGNDNILADKYMQNSNLPSPRNWISLNQPGSKKTKSFKEFLQTRGKSSMSNGSSANDQDLQGTKFLMGNNLETLLEINDQSFQHNTDEFNQTNPFEKRVVLNNPNKFDPALETSSEGSNTNINIEASQIKPSRMYTR